jgi:hypothetical protein
MARPRRLAIGDPQGPLPKLLEILDRHEALGDDGRLASTVHLVSIGDHFDWGQPADRERAAADGLAVLAWLAAQPPDQATLVLGNHDLARVGELAGFDDAGYRAARGEADAAYRSGAVDRAAQARFLERHPAFPTAEAAARDISTFSVAQRTLVTSLLRARRFVLALAAAPDLLLCHAGVTLDELLALGLPPEAPATAIAEALNAALDAACEHWTPGEPLAIPGLHRPGSAAQEEGRGMLFHRPANPEREGEDAKLYDGPPRRRFDPRRLPAGLTQAIGHIRDAKCREILGPWADGGAAVDGPLRHLRVAGGAVRYRRGLPEAADARAATLLFLDGGIFWANAAHYELLDLGTRRAAL